MLRGERVRIFDARLSHEQRSAAPGAVVGVGDAIDVALAGGVLHAQRLQRHGGKKLSAPEFAAETGIKPGSVFEYGLPPEK